MLDTEIGLSEINIEDDDDDHVHPLKKSKSAGSKDLNFEEMGQRMLQKPRNQTLKESKFRPQRLELILSEFARRQIWDQLKHKKELE